MISFTPSNTVVLQNIPILFPFSSFSTNGSSLQVLIFVLTATPSFILNLAVLVIIPLLSLSLFSEFGLTSFPFTTSSSSFILIFLFDFCLFSLLYIYLFTILLLSTLHYSTIYCFSLLLLSVSVAYIM